MCPLYFLHGPPAAGKYTVGLELSSRTGAELFHNHIVVDAVLARHAFGTPEFILERDRQWRERLSRAAVDAPRGVIFTFNPENTVPQTFIDWLFHDLPSQRLRLHSIALTSSEAFIESRLASQQRRGFRKLSDVDLYRRLRGAGAFTQPVIPRTDLSLDTGELTPPEAADVILRAFASA